MQAGKRVQNQTREDGTDASFWLGALLLASCVALFFQVFPSVWWSVVSFGALIISYVDVRNWTWRSYAVISVIAIAALLVAKGRQDSRG